MHRKQLLSHFGVELREADFIERNATLLLNVDSENDDRAAKISHAFFEFGFRKLAWRTKQFQQ